MSAESGIPTYRGLGGIWDQYDWAEYACQSAFDADPIKVLKFHELRRNHVFNCKPHAGYYKITEMQQNGHKIHIITQNIDGLHNRAKSDNIIELHGSLWRLRCDTCKSKWDQYDNEYDNIKCSDCGGYKRPDIVWFGDMLDIENIENALSVVRECQLFIGVGTSGVVWPAAGIPFEAKTSGAFCIEINSLPSDKSTIYDETIVGTAMGVIPNLFLAT
ncbi:NAD-dependent deacetylase [Candidatus Neomarinimicrobiota bacterium]